MLLDAVGRIVVQKKVYTGPNVCTNAFHVKFQKKLVLHICITYVYVLHIAKQIDLACVNVQDHHLYFVFREIKPNKDNFLSVFMRLFRAFVCECVWLCLVCLRWCVCVCGEWGEPNNQKTYPFQSVSYKCTHTVALIHDRILSTFGDSLRVGGFG